jgi:hypothetical protein
MRPIDTLYKKSKSIQDKIDALRKKCPHKAYRVAWYSWRPGAMDPQRLCKACDAVLPGITYAEGLLLREEFGKSSSGFAKMEKR